MRILIFHERAAERERLVRTLSKEKHVVLPAADARELVARLTEGGLDVVLVGWTAKPSLEVVKLIRATQPFATMVAVVDTAEEMAALAKAGVHEFLRRPLFVEEIVARAHTLAKLCATRAAKPELEALSLWGDLGATMTEQLAAATGWKPPILRPLSSPPPTDIHAGSVVLSLPQDEAEIRVAIVADANAERALAGTLLCDANARREQLDDMLRELANVVGASVKRSLTEERHEPTTGLPNNDAFTLTPARSRRAWRLSNEYLLAFVVEVHTRKNRRLPAGKLIEGMVLVNDLRSEAGALVVPAGTCLTCTTAERVRDIVGDQTFVEIAEAS